MQSYEPVTMLFIAEVITSQVPDNLLDALVKGGIAVGVIWWFMKKSTKDFDEIKKGIYAIKFALEKQTIATERASRAKLLELMHTTQNPVIVKQARELLTSLPTDDTTKPPF